MNALHYFYYFIFFAVPLYCRVRTLDFEILQDQVKKTKELKQVLVLFHRISTYRAKHKNAAK